MKLSTQTVKTAFLCVFGMKKWLGVDVMEDFNALSVQFFAGHLWLSFLGLAHLAKSDCTVLDVHILIS